jgi:hypothetical protein
MAIGIIYLIMMLVHHSLYKIIVTHMVRSMVIKYYTLIKHLIYEIKINKR